MVSSLEESYLSSAGLSPLRTHFIASLENVWYDNYLLRILPTTFARQFHHNSSPKSPLCAHSFQKGQKYPKAPYERFLSRKARGNLLSLKEEKEKASTHWSLAKEFKRGVQIKWPTKTFSSVSPFSPSSLNIWNSIRPEFDQPTSRELFFSSAI